MSNLGPLYISQSFNRLLQIGNEEVLDGTGSIIQLVTSSIANWHTEVSRSAALAGFGPPSGSIANQNAFSFIDISGSTTIRISSTSTTDTFTFKSTDAIDVITSSLGIEFNVLTIPTSSITNFNLEVSRSAANYGFGSNGSGSTDYNDLNNIPNNIVSSSNQTGSVLGLGQNDTVTFGNVIVNNNVGVKGNMLVDGTLTAREYILSSSVSIVTMSFSSGSNIFGDTLDDNHQFTGSVSITGSIYVNGNDITEGVKSGSFTGSFSGSLIGDGNNIININTSSINNWGLEVSRSAAYYGFGATSGSSGESNTMSTLGSGISIYKEKDGINFNMRSLTTGSNEISMSIVNDEIVIDLISVDGGVI